jgi:hypothetical protein
MIAGMDSARRVRPVFIGLVALLCVSLQVAVAAEKAPGKAAIASAHPLATQAGLEVLAKVAMRSMRPSRWPVRSRWWSRAARG